MEAIIEGLRTGVEWVFEVTAYPILAYFLVINTSLLLLILFASVNFTAHLRRQSFAGARTTAASPLSPGISVIIPAYNESTVIATSVRSVLDLRYPDHEVVIVNDGSTDDTLQILIDSYGLVEDPRDVLIKVPVRGQVRAVYRARDAALPIVVIDTENSGRSDSLNMGLNAASKDLVVMVDADSLLDPDSLLVVSKPFTDDPERVIATGGVVRVANGCEVVGGRVVNVKMPRNYFARIQIVEYLRSFLLGRAGWSQLNSLILISGAFGMFRRDLVIEAGGLDADCIGEDFELVMRLHRRMRLAKKKYRVVFIAEPVCWTEVPSTAAVLARQRRRWHRGLWEVLTKYRGMTFNPRYGSIGMVALPYYWIFELIAPAIELFGIIIVPLGLLLGVVNVPYALAFIAVAYLYAIFVSLMALLVEEASFHRYNRWQDLWVALLVSVQENLGYRQLTAVWRIQGWWAALRGKKQVWGTMTRTGFESASK
ncbi:cellulose synthase/poly-beta-1,6-N-acetylglucosamine synthase-like glycosyltransferase [Arthrobacter pigmenti]|uniref:Cellulose synthase/poly-beta-1,6-N-acetylglucosamine synthase-like glycosyltransferase n=1 Tax=Arthrobacter pigmenti TaxID=271432 RepID=A0A846RY56_9MICC|nr:cellulose synthase/poly-beta-1,6-N-acetylglucosamine synthase-like glycosyltransferase [Arthrobacter pigmenti]